MAVEREICPKCDSWVDSMELVPNPNHPEQKICQECADKEEK